MINIKARQIKQILALIIIVVIGWFVFNALFDYISAFAGSLILFTLLYPVNKLFNKWMGKKTSALLCIMLSILVIIIPLAFLSNILVKEVTDLTQNSKDIIKDSKLLEDSISKYEKYSDKEVELTKLFSETGSFIKDGLKKTANAFFRSVIHFMISSIILYVTLFFLLINSDKFIKSVENGLPFNEKNSKRLMFEFVKVTRSTVIGEGLIAIAQGTLIGIGFMLFGIKGAVFWGFIGAILSFLPFVGVTLIWVPVMIYQLAVGNYFVGIGFALFCGIIITGSDYGLRPYLAKKFANIHPLVTLLGIFIGIPYFGVFGLLVGPLLLSYLFLLIRMYGEEYLKQGKV